MISCLKSLLNILTLDWTQLVPHYCPLRSGYVSKNQNKAKKPNTQGILSKQAHPPRQTPITQKVTAPRHRKFQNGSKK